MSEEPKPSATAKLLGLWRALSHRPGGKWLFSILLGRTVPYSGTVRPRVQVLEPGRAVVEITDRRGIRNHLRSVHAIALANVGELCSGLALTSALPGSVRAIVLSLEIEFVKKARGTLTATSTVVLPGEVVDGSLTEPLDHMVTAEITDEAEEVVATVKVRWRIGPR